MEEYRHGKLASDPPEHTGQQINAQLISIHRVSKKLCKLIFCQNFVKFQPIVKIFGIKIAEKTSFSEVYSFSTSPNLCQHTTVLNADVPNCYITL